MLYSYHERMLNDENMYIYFSYVNKFGRTNLKNSSKNTCTVYLYIRTDYWDTENNIINSPTQINQAYIAFPS